MELIKDLKDSKIIKNIFLALIGTVLLAVSSKIKIPFYPVPMTMQTFVVLFLGIVLGWRLGCSSSSSSSFYFHVAELSLAFCRQ